MIDRPHVFYTPHLKGKATLLVKTYVGLEHILEQELRALGATQIELVARGVRCMGDKNLIYRINYSSRVAIRVLALLSEFEINSEEDFYKGVAAVDWSVWLNEKQTLAVKAVTQSDDLTNSHYVALLTKDAVVDQFRDRTGQRPSIELDQPDFLINVHLSKTNFCSLYADASVGSLHRRGYRAQTGLAPISEALAAGMLMLANYNGYSIFADTMCGSGTLAIEAALIAAKIPPGSIRKTPFGFERWPDFDAALWEKTKTEALAVQKKPDAPILASDIDLHSIALAQQNAKIAGVSDYIQFDVLDFAEVEVPNEVGLLLINPPYDIRLENDDLPELYRQVGSDWKQRWKGWRCGMISADVAAIKSVGLHPDKKFMLHNGQLECRFHLYSLFAGDRRSFKQDQEG